VRQLRIVVQKAGGALPLVISAAIVSAPACGESSSSDTAGMGGTSGRPTNVGGMAGQGGNAAGQGGIVIAVSGGTGGALLGGSSGSLGDGGGSGDRGEPACPAESVSCFEQVVSIPEPGVPAEPGQICAATLEPVTSNRAALVTFEERSGDRLLLGRIAIADELDGLVVGTPTLEVVDTSSSILAGLVFSNFEVADGGFTFQAAAHESLDQVTGGVSRVTLRATLAVKCDDDERTVHSATDVFFCDGPTLNWASSGDACCVCRVIAEMAPSPIVPGDVADDLPLARALRLRIVELARVQNTLILLAENDGGAGLDYEWLASVGSVERLAPDVVCWTLAQGQLDPLIQAAVSGPGAAAVASYAFNEHAA
jgi:hypothetical protein